jgi:hypothetical protein
MASEERLKLLLRSAFGDRPRPAPDAP